MVLEIVFQNSLWEQFLFEEREAAAYDEAAVKLTSVPIKLNDKEQKALKASADTLKYVLKEAF